MMGADLRFSMATAIRRWVASMDQKSMHLQSTVALFLWHQVRCMVAILFLVGQGLEDPAIVNALLDVEGNEHIGRPQYEMADDGPLVLWDCRFW